MMRCSPWAACAILSAAAHAQPCESEWRTGFQFTQLNGAIEAVSTFDDGSGPRLYIGGAFSQDGNAPLHGVGRWNGSAYEPVGAGLIGTVHDLEVFDSDGAGPIAPWLVAAGRFEVGGVLTSVAMWDGQAWMRLDAGLPAAESSGTAMRALEVHDPGQGPRLYVAGNSSPSRVLVLDQGVWSPLAGDFANGSELLALESHDDGSGAALYVGGKFPLVGGVAASNVARWRDGVWSALGTGVGESTLHSVTSLLSVNLGATQGPCLVVGGQFTRAGSTTAAGVAFWRQNDWVATNALVGPTYANVAALTTFDIGGTPTLVAAGAFGGLPGSDQTVGMVRWDGQAWLALTTRLANVRTLKTLDLGAGPRIVAAGAISHADDTPLPLIGTWDGASWAPVGDFGGGFDNSVQALAVADTGDGLKLYAAGAFSVAGSQRANGVVVQSGPGWQALGSGMSGRNPVFVNVLTTVREGPHDVVYAGGKFTHADGLVVNNVARWDGGQWSALGDGLSFSTPASASVNAIAFFDPDGDGPQAGYVVAGGRVDSSGAVPVSGVARWNGTSWLAIPGIPNALSAVVNALASFDPDGNGPAAPVLAAGGHFQTPVGPRYFAHWNGVEWSFDASVPTATQLTSLVVHDDGTGRKLYAGGTFTGNTTTVARWTGVLWESVGVVPGRWSTWNHADAPIVGRMCSVTVGPHRGLYITGNFSNSPTGVRSVAKWTGSAWERLGNGLGVGGGVVPALGFTGGRDIALLNDRLYIGGTFAGAYPAGSSAPTIVSRHIAAFRLCRATCTPDFNGDGSPGTDADIEAFFACLAGNCCVTCGSADFDNDGDVGTDADIEAFFRVLGGGNC